MLKQDGSSQEKAKLEIDKSEAAALGSQAKAERENEERKHGQKVDTGDDQEEDKGSGLVTLVLPYSL